MNRDQKQDFIYLCFSVSDMVSVPVRIFDGKEVFSNVSTYLTADPFSVDRDRKEESETIGYYSRENRTYFYVKNDPYDVFFGPTGANYEKREILDLSARLRLTKNEENAFADCLRSLRKTPAEDLLQALFVVRFYLTGEKLRLEDVYIKERAQDEIKKDIKTEVGEKADENTTDRYKNYLTERFIVDIVSSGDREKFSSFLDSYAPVKGWNVGYNQLRRMKNVFVSTATVVSRAAIDGGMDVSEAIALSDAYIRKSELTNDINALSNLQFRMVVDYIDAVAETKKRSASLWEKRVRSYVKTHLSEPITAEMIAKEFSLSRPYLSAVFRREVGVPLHEFIVREKIEEGKRRLLYSDRTIAEIGDALGFSSQSHFSNVFRSFTGVTPRAYRKQRS